MSKGLFCRALCVLAVLALRLPVAWAAETVDTDPKHKLPRPAKRASRKTSFRR